MICEISVHDSREDWGMSETAHLVLGSPPYNAGLKYDVYDDNITEEQWDEDFGRVCEMAYSALVDGGRMAVNITDIGYNPRKDMQRRAKDGMIAAGFNLINVIIWDKNTSGGTAWGSWQMASAPVIRDCHEYIIVGQKGAKLNVSGYDKREWEKGEFPLMTQSIWEMNPASAKKVGHPAPFPVELPMRLIKLYTQKGMVVVDPWVGSGTSAEAAMKLECNFVGFDVSAKYVDMANERIANL